MSRYFLITPLAAALALGLGGAIAATPDAARQKELEAARADLQRAAQRVAELSGVDAAHREVIIERRMLRGPVLGVVLDADDKPGVLVAGVAPGSGAAEAGLKQGDRLLRVDGVAIAGADGEARLVDLRTRLRKLDEKTPVALAYQRDGREATVKVTPRMGEPVVMLHGAEGAPFGFPGEPAVFAFDADEQIAMATRMAHGAPGGVAPEIRREIVRIDGGPPCPDETCRFTMLEDAFRWNGLNLVSVSPQLGRYFGSDRGVLVISVPDGMGGLQPGDVILRMDGKEVATPREAMASAHAREPGTKVPVEYLRDRKRASTTLTIPERRMLRLPAPPAPPAPPPPPGAPRAHAAPHALPAPPPPPPVPGVPAVAPAPMALAAPPAPPAPPAPVAGEAPPAPPAPPRVP